MRPAPPRSYESPLQPPEREIEATLPLPAGRARTPRRAGPPYRPSPGPARGVGGPRTNTGEPSETGCERHRGTVERDGSMGACAFSNRVRAGDPRRSRRRVGPGHAGGHHGHDPAPDRRVHGALDLPIHPPSGGPRTSFTSLSRYGNEPERRGVSVRSGAGPGKWIEVVSDDVQGEGASPSRGRRRSGDVAGSVFHGPSTGAGSLGPQGRDHPAMIPTHPLRAHLSFDEATAGQWQRDARRCRRASGNAGGGCGTGTEAGFETGSHDFGSVSDRGLPQRTRGIAVTRGAGMQAVAITEHGTDGAAVSLRTSDRASKLLRVRQRREAEPAP